MRIGLDARKLTRKNKVGVDVYSTEIISQIINLDQKNQYFLLTDSLDSAGILMMQFGSKGRVDFINMSNPILWTYIALPILTLRNKIDLIYLPIDYLPIRLPRTLKLVPTVHDLAPILFPKTVTTFHHLRSRFQLWDISHRADAVVTISESSKKDFLDRFPDYNPEMVIVAYPAPRELFSGRVGLKEIAQTKNKYQLDQYLLYVGTLQARKGLDILFQAFDQIKPKFSNLKLVVVGKKGWEDALIHETFQKMLYQDSVIFTGYAPDAELPPLYAGAMAFVLPSLYEGFGIPVVEAMRTGTPVICSSNSSLIEVGGDAALLFDTGNVTELASSLEQVVTGKSVRERMIRIGKNQAALFSWKTSSLKVVKLFNELENE